MLPVIGALRPWADPTVVALHRLPMHVPFDGFDRRSLDGDWSLELFDSPDAVPADAITGDRGGAVIVAVPGNWTLQDLGGFVDLPQYTNVQMPFPGPPPRLPDRNPTGVYRRSFTVPTAWRRRRTVLHVGGAESVHAVYVNGEFAGYGTDSRLPSEYEIGHLARPGRNDLAIVVVRWSAQSYVEDQDQWWMAGLHRSVWLESRPRVHLADLPVDVDYDPATGRGTIAATAPVQWDDVDGPQAGWTIRATLTDPAGRQVGREQQVDVPHRHRRPYVFGGFTATARWEFSKARPWSAERPDRYAVSVELCDPSGRVRHTEVQHVGVRRVEVRDRALLVNGQPIWVFGVNRHDQHPDRGKAVTADDMRDDLRQMALHNINAIRTAHYPNEHTFADLCDELGFYVVAEANIEAHAYNRSLADDPEYRATWLERGARMVQRDRNHPSIILWSLGNESGYGTSHEALAGWIRRSDPSRPLHYEEAITVDGWVDGGRLATDVVCPMYASIDAIRSYAEAGEGDRPLILCEYSHAMGNSNGSLADYWDVITSTPGLQGGFIWEWKDHGLRQRLPDGSARLAFGGQFGERPHDGNFVADGLMGSDLDPHPAMREVAWVHRPVTVERVRGGLRIANRRSFVDLADLGADWELLVGDRVAERGTLTVPRLAPRSDTVVPLPCDGRRGVLTVRWTTRRDTWFASAGHLVAWDQVVLGSPSRPAPPTGGRSPDELVRPELTIWRAPVDNDGFKLMPDLSRRIGVGGKALVRWQDHGVDARAADELVGHRADVDRAADATTYRHVVDVPDAFADLPRVGVVFRLPGRFDRVRWAGRGPHENYPDRNASALLGVWEQAPDESPYLVPQEFGLRTDCRWIEVVDSSTGERVRVDVVEPSVMHVSATHHTAADLYEAPTATELRRRDELVVHLDVAHRGLGTASCGPDVLDRYRLPAGRFEFAYRVTVLDGPS